MRRPHYSVTHLRQAWVLNFYRTVSQLHMLHMHSNPETRYPQIQKELSSIVFACDCFHSYVYDHKEVISETDHKPLKPIFTKPLASAQKCPQRMKLHLHQHNLTVKYKKERTFTLQTHFAELISRR